MELTKQQALEIADRFERGYHFSSFKTGEDCSSGYDYELVVKVGRPVLHDVQFRGATFKFSDARSIFCDVDGTETESRNRAIKNSAFCGVF